MGGRQRQSLCHRRRRRWSSSWPSSLSSLSLSRVRVFAFVCARALQCAPCCALVARCCLPRPSCACMAPPHADDDLTVPPRPRSRHQRKSHISVSTFGGAMADKALARRRVRVCTRVRFRSCAPARSRVRLVVRFFLRPGFVCYCGAVPRRAAPHVRVGRVVACECVGVQAVDRWATCAGRRPTSSIGHNYISHNYIGHNYIGHNYIGHTYTGHNYAQAGVRRPLAPTQPCACKHPRTLNRCTGDITA